MEQELEVQRIIAEGLTSLQLSADAAPVLTRYESLLLEKNQVMNLTAITDPVKAARLHMLDCAALLHDFDFRNRRVIDVGTGAGFPGMVLKLIEPSISLTLLDSLGKRIAWLKELSSELQDPDIELIHGRAEDYGIRPAYRDAFDIAVSRAVAELRVLCELCLPFVRTGGLFIAMKSTDCGEELSSAEAAIAKLGGALQPVIDYAIPGTDVTHRLIVIRKIRPTPKGYPRRFTKIRKTPL